MRISKQRQKQFQPHPWLGMGVQQALAILVAAVFLCYPLTGYATGMIGVAKVAGRAERNGLPLLNGSIVSSGDSLRTGAKSLLFLSPTPQEKLWLGSETYAKLSGKAGNMVIALNRGTVRFESAGKIQVNIGGHNVVIRSAASSPVLAQLTYLDGRGARVWLQKGSLEITQGGHSVVLRAGQSGLIPATNSAVSAERTTKNLVRSNAQSTNQANTGSVKGNVVNARLFVVPNATVTLQGPSGFTYTTTTDAQGAFTFSNIPPGTYVLRVPQPGHRPFEMQSVVVTSGKATSVYVELKGGKAQAGTSHKGLIIGVVVGAGAAAGIGIGLGLRSSSKTAVSPTSIP